MAVNRPIADASSVAMTPDMLPIREQMAQVIGFMGVVRPSAILPVFPGGGFARD
ncbi:MAG: hypothetical protein ACI8W7_000641 [Gammaproteobacteria bacterium]|jgi:hypothetical protein